MTAERWIIAVLVLVLIALVFVHVFTEKVLSAEEEHSTAMARELHYAQVELGKRGKFIQALLAKNKNQSAVIGRLKKRLAKKSGYTV